MKKSFLFVSCDEAKHICDKAQYGEASNWERFKLTLRLFYCGITKSYSKKNKNLSKALQNGKVECLKSDERNKLQKQFNDELSKEHQN